MRIFKFLKWWWNNNDQLNRIVVAFIILWLMPWGIAGIWIGEQAVVVILCGFVGVFAGLTLAVVYKWIKDMWYEFNKENPPDDIAIIRKLKGE